MDFVRSHFGKMKLWPVEHFWLTFFQISADLEKKWAKSVQLVRVSFFLIDFLQNPYFESLTVKAASTLQLINFFYMRTVEVGTLFFMAVSSLVWYNCHRRWIFISIWRFFYVLVGWTGNGGGGATGSSIYRHTTVKTRTN